MPNVMLCDAQKCHNRWRGPLMRLNRHACQVVDGWPYSALERREQSNERAALLFYVDQFNSTMLIVFSNVCGLEFSVANINSIVLAFISISKFI